jgi:hypothetical protein
LRLDVNRLSVFSTLDEERLAGLLTAILRTGDSDRPPARKRDGERTAFRVLTEARSRPDSDRERRP